MILAKPLRPAIGLFAVLLAAGLAADAARAGDVTATPFDIAKVPLSTATLGAFPFLGLPDGYRYINDPQPRDFDQFPFWTGKGFHAVEGPLFMAYIRAEPGKAYSAVELKRNIETELAGLGAVKLTDMRIPNGTAHALPRPMAADKAVGLGDFYNNAVSTYVIHQTGREIWVHFTTSGSGASWAILEAKPFQSTARPLPAAR